MFVFFWFYLESFGQRCGKRSAEARRSGRRLESGERSVAAGRPDVFLYDAPSRAESNGPATPPESLESLAIGRLAIDAPDVATPTATPHRAQGRRLDEWPVDGASLATSTEESVRFFFFVSTTTRNNNNSNEKKNAIFSTLPVSADDGTFPKLVHSSTTTTTTTTTTATTATTATTSKRNRFMNAATFPRRIVGRASASESDNSNDEMIEEEEEEEEEEEKEKRTPFYGG